MNVRLRRPFFSPAFSLYGLSEITSPDVYKRQVNVYISDMKITEIPQK